MFATLTSLASQQAIGADSYSMAGELFGSGVSRLRFAEMLLVQEAPAFS